MRIRRLTSVAVLALLLAAGGVLPLAGPAAAIPLPPPGGGLNIRSAQAWGDNRAGQLGDATLFNRTTPVQPVGLDSGVSQVAAGEAHTLAVSVSGTVVAWGRNTDGQLGDGTLDAHFIPLAVSTVTGVTKVSAGNAHSLALRADGTVWAWGDNSRGQLGDGTLIDRRTPVRVSGLTGVTQISAGTRFNLARRSDGTVWAWGENTDGQLGDGTVTDRRTPVRAVGLAGAIQVAAGASHSLALRSDGVAFAWGQNAFGALGDGTVVSHVIPRPVTLVTAVSQVAAGIGYSLVLSGGVPHWFGLECHQGGPDVAVCVSEAFPVAHPVGLTGVTQIAAGGSHNLAIRSDGTLWAWGSNFFGQIGDGSTVFRVQPVRIVAANGAVQIDAGPNHSAVVVSRPPVLQP